jgi:hypothetical protein
MDLKWQKGTVHGVSNLATQHNKKTMQVQIAAATTIIKTPSLSFGKTTSGIMIGTLSIAGGF